MAYQPVMMGIGCQDVEHGYTRGALIKLRDAAPLGVPYAVRFNYLLDWIGCHKDGVIALPGRYPTKKVSRCS